jgi:dipeptidyl aminopeptidase/acylaminoacyl peptidase
MAQFGGTDTYHSSERQLGLPWKDPETYWDASPTAHVEGVSTPTLLIHSEQDYRVPIHNADVLYRHLKKVGVEVELVRYPREGHELSRAGEPQHVVDRLERIREWFDVNAT